MLITLWLLVKRALENVNWESIWNNAMAGLILVVGIIILLSCVGLKFNLGQATNGLGRAIWRGFSAIFHGIWIAISFLFRQIPRIYRTVARRALRSGLTRGKADLIATLVTLAYVAILI